MSINAKAVIKMAERTMIRFGGKKDSVAYFLKVLDGYMRRLETASDYTREYHDVDLIGTLLDGAVSKWFYSNYEYEGYEKFKVDLKKRWGRTIRAAMTELQTLQYRGGDAHEFLESMINLADESEIDPSLPKDMFLLEDVLIRAVTNQAMALDLKKFYSSDFGELSDYFLHLCEVYYPEGPISSPLPNGNQNQNPYPKPPPILKSARFEPPPEQSERWRTTLPIARTTRGGNRGPLRTCLLRPTSPETGRSTSPTLSPCSPARTPLLPHPT